MKATFHAPEIDCAGCAHSIKIALRRMTGVSSVSVDIPAKIVTVEYAQPATEQQLENTLDNIGFPTAVTRV